MRLIDADALKPKVEAMVIHKFNESDYEYGGNQAFDYVADILIDDAPTIDAVEVVRCGECKHRSEDGECDCNSLYMQMEGDSIGVGFVPEKDFYCAYGERREDIEA